MFFEKMNKTDEHSCTDKGIKTDITLITKIRNDRGDTTCNLLQK